MPDSMLTTIKIWEATLAAQLPALLFLTVAVALVCRLPAGLRSTHTDRRSPLLPPALRCWLCWLVCARLLATPLLAQKIPVATVAILPPLSEYISSSDSPNSISLTVVRNRPAIPVSNNRISSVLPAPLTVIEQPHPIVPMDIAALALFGLWTAGCLFGLARLIADTAFAVRLRRTAQPIEPEGESERGALGKVALAMAWRGPLPQLLATDMAVTPLVTGLLRPVILIPARWSAEVTDHEMQMALAHELGHLKRGDLWLAKVPMLARILFFAFPPLWLLPFRAWESAREEACDALALAATGASPAQYSRLLLRILVVDRRRSAWAGLSGGDAMLHVGGSSYRTLEARLCSLVSAGSFGGLKGSRMLRLVVVAAVSILCLVSAIPARLTPIASANSNADRIASKRPPSSAKYSAMRLMNSGRELTPAQAKLYEVRLQKSPQDLIARIKLIAFYWTNGHGALQDVRVEHVFWLINNQPTSAALSLPICIVSPDIPSNNFSKAETLWQGAIAEMPNDARVLANAAYLYMFSDKAKEQALLQRACSAEPKNPQWFSRLAESYSLEMDNKSGDSRKPIAARALSAYERAAVLADFKADFANSSYARSRMAQCAFEAGQYDKASQLSTDLVRNAKQDMDAIHHGNLILGRIALREGNTAIAETYLLTAGRVTGSPVLNSFGPNMMLAKEMVGAGHSEAVLHYFVLCRKFWNRHELRQWEADVKAGRKPNFGANLSY